MDSDSRKRTRIIIIASIVLLVVAAAIGWQVYMALQAPKPNPNLTDDITRRDTQETVAPTQEDAPQEQLPDRSNEDMSATIVKASPTLVDTSGQPNFTILKVVRPMAGWYVTTIEPTDKSSEKAKVIFKDTGGDKGLTIIAGPGTYFPPQFVKVPDPVRKALTQ